jgi:hypothetical protein
MLMSGSKDVAVKKKGGGTIERSWNIYLLQIRYQLDRRIERISYTPATFSHCPPLTHVSFLFVRTDGRTDGKVKEKTNNPSLTPTRPVGRVQERERERERDRER